MLRYAPASTQRTLLESDAFAILGQSVLNHAEWVNSDDPGRQRSLAAEIAFLVRVLCVLWLGLHLCVYGCGCV